METGEVESEKRKEGKELQPLKGKGAQDLRGWGKNLCRTPLPLWLSLHLYEFKAIDILITKMHSEMTNSSLITDCPHITVCFISSIYLWLSRSAVHLKPLQHC